MPLHQTDAYVLRTYTLQEADKICVLLTREAGKIRGVAHGARRLRSRFGSSLEPFTEVSVTYFQKENRELVSISSCEILQSQFQEVLSSELLGLLHYFAELVIEFVPDHEPNDRVYRLVSAMMQAMQAADSAQLIALARYCEIWMLRLAGFLPELRRCSLCRCDLGGETSAWLALDGSPQCLMCSGRRGEEIRPDVTMLLGDILALSPVDFIASRRQARPLAHVASIGARLIYRALERELKSIEVLDQMRPVMDAIGRR
jgi:DNA repair protein RecO (recombination protein O)